MNSHSINTIAAVLFGVALLHTFSANYITALAHRFPAHSGLLHLLGEIEVVFGFWAFILIALMAMVLGGGPALEYAESRQYTEPLFVFVVMVVAASRPILSAVQQMLSAIARTLPVPAAITQAWLGLAIVPLLGSLITEPAAMTLAALILAPWVFRSSIPEFYKYAALGVLFVNVSIGGTLTSYAAPPVLMVAATWQWDTAFMASQFGWKAAIAVIINASAVTWLLRRHLVTASNGQQPAADTAVKSRAQSPSTPASVSTSVSNQPIPYVVTLVHVLFLAGVVLSAHHPVVFLALFMLFLGFTQAYQRYQNPLILKEGLLVGFFLAGLVVLGGMQQWWLQPIVSKLQPLALFFGSVGLTAITDNAALTYLGSLIVGISDNAKYMLVAGAVAGGGLTVIANAPNPAGVALLKQGFADGSIGAGSLLLGALPPTAVAIAAFLLL